MVLLRVDLFGSSYCIESSSQFKNVNERIVATIHAVPFFCKMYFLPFRRSKNRGLIKGTVSNDFRTLFLSIKHLPRGHWFTYSKMVENSQIYSSFKSSMKLLSHDWEVSMPCWVSVNKILYTISHHHSPVSLTLLSFDSAVSMTKLSQF
jgi:hypothetical protein